MKRLFTLLAATAATLGLQAQNVLLEVGGGLSSTYKDTRCVGTYKLGVGYEYEFGQHWAIEPALAFYGKGWREPDALVPVYDPAGEPVLDEAGEPLMGKKGTTYTANYLELPVLFHYYLRTGPARYIRFSAGPYGACGVGGKMKVRGDADRPGSDKLYYDRHTFGSAGVKRLDAGVQVRLSYQFNRNVSAGVESDFGLVRLTPDGRRNLSGLIALTWHFHTSDAD